MMPVDLSRRRPRGRFCAINVKGRLPVVWTVQRNGVPGRMPVTKGGWICGASGGGVIEIAGSAAGVGGVCDRAAGVPKRPNAARTARRNGVCFVSMVVRGVIITQG